MVQQSQNRWHAPPPEQSSHSSATPTVASWMQDVLGRPAPSQSSNPQPYPKPVGPGNAHASSQPGASGQPAPDLQSRLAAIARNIQALESKIAGDPVPHHPADAAMGDPLEALRRRKMTLERGAGQHPGLAPQATMDQPPTYETTAATEPQSAPDGLDQLATHLDEQLYQLTHAVNDIRKLAETSAAGQAGLSQKVEALQSRVEQPVAGPALEPSSEPSMAQLSAQVRAVQDAISAMPKMEAVKSLEDGYHHILARLDGLKMDGTPDHKIDALYAEVSSLREVLDGLSSSGTASMVGEMRSMIAQLEAHPNGNDDRITEALESIREMARGGMPGQDQAFIREAIGSVVERLVALEARIEALAAGADDSVVTKRLDAIQSEMARLSMFQDEARGLASALDTIRQEMRDVSSSAESLNLGELQRFEEMAGSYTAQVAELSARLHALDGALDTQAEMAREVASLSRQMNSFTAAMPIREIEQSLLDLTSRVTALQEDTGAERLAMAVRSLGERVEACLNSIPKTETIVEAVEARLDRRMNGLDTRLDGLHKAISNADAPLIDHLSKRLETLIAAIPTPRADEALASLEQQLADINARQAQSDAVSGEEVASLHKELARVGASVELASNRELQRSIVEEVRHLADRFDAARTTGNADILPEIEQQIEVLAARFQSLGLFDPSVAATVPDHLIERLEERLDAYPTASGLNDLQTELVSLRENASDQDKRMYATLESMQSALETVIDRIGALETDDRAARALAGETARDEGVDAPKARQPEKASLETSKPDVPRPEAPKPMADNGEPAPEPGDAKTLLRQLSGAMDEPVQRAEAESPMPAQPAVASAPQTATPDIASQRASFIAAARRAAQTAALQAGGGVPRSAQAMPSALDALQPSPYPADPNTRIEPDLEPAASDPELAEDPFEEADDLAGARGKKKKNKKPKEEQAGKQRSLSRAMLIALVLFTVGLGLFVVNLIAPVDQIGDSVFAPADAPVDDGAAAPGLAPRVVGDDPVEAGRIPEAPAVTPDEPVAARDTLSDAPQPLPAQEPASVPDAETESAANGAAGAVAGTLAARNTVGTGFERDRGPIMAETPQLSAAAPILPPPANDLGPLINPTPPPLPTATADSLPEAIGSPRLRVAAASGDPAAEFEIAARFMEGRFVPQDLAAAAHWYGRAAQQGIAPAAYRLGSFYEQGRGVERSRDGAVAWYEQAALEGNPRAMHNLAVMAAEGAGQAPDFAQAAAWFIPAANRGLADSQFNLAVLYARGMGVERDLMESYKWFALAANAGDSEAVNRRDEVAGVLDEETLALARARVDNWVPIPVERASVEVPRPDGGWDDASTRAGLSTDATPAQRLIAEAQTLLSQRGYDPGPADGLLGPRTNNAVRAFRQSVGLGDSDVIDQALLDALRAGTSL